MFINIGFILLICQPTFTIRVAPCFLVGILHNNRLRHGEPSYRAFSRDVIAAMLVSHEQKISH
jgi:hypothetical protein